jgi:hypothetical protein
MHETWALAEKHLAEMKQGPSIYSALIEETTVTVLYVIKEQIYLDK